MTDPIKTEGASTLTENLPETNPNPVLSAGLDGKPAFINQATLQILHELQLENVEDILPTNHKKIVAACLNTNTRLREERKVSDRTINWFYHPVIESDIVYIYGHDISEYCSTTPQTKTFPELNPSPVLSYESDGTLLFSNPAATQLMKSIGVEYIEDILPKNHNEIIRTHPKKGSPHTEEHKIANHTIVWSYHVADQNGVINVYGHDVSDYCSRIESTENFPAANPNPVLSTDPEGTPVFANPATLHLLENLKLDNVIEILPDNHKNLVMACLKTNTPLTEECLVEGHTIAWSYHPVSASKAVYIYGHDISDYCLDNTTTMRLPALNPSPVISTRSNGEMIFINPATTQLLQDLKLKNLNDILPAHHQEVIKTCLTMNTPLTEECKVADRTIIWSYQPINDNEVIYIYGHDVSDYH